MQRPRLLYVDAYDSFARNIVALLEQSLHATVTIVYIDDERLRELSQHEFATFFSSRFDAVVIGPGPGDPRLSKDVGIIPRLWSLNNDDIIPILGVCLGFQSMCLYFGAKIGRLKEPKHGLVTEIQTKPGSILDISGRSNDNLMVTHYHSLHIQLPSFDSSSPWTPTSQLQPLAWDLEDEDNGPVLEAARHVSKPFWGFQFHPESICTQHGTELIVQWWAHAKLWNEDHHKSPYPPQSPHNVPSSQSIDAMADLTAEDSTIASHIFALRQHSNLAPSLSNAVRYATIPAATLSLHDTWDLFRTQTSMEPILLESGVYPDGKILYPHTGRYSILGVVEVDTLLISLDLDNEVITIKHGNEVVRSEKGLQIWPFMMEWMRLSKVAHGRQDLPFWGGLIGYISYETGLKTRLKVVASTMNSVRPKGSVGGLRPDMAFAFTTRSVVFDHAQHEIVVQSILLDDDDWISDTKAMIEKRILSQQNGAVSHRRLNTDSESEPLPSAEIISQPDRREYCANVQNCDDEIRAGNSYELCLTDRIHVRVPPGQSTPTSAWSLYRQLMRTNTAPFSTYMHMNTGDNAITIIGSSPERFFSWRRDGLCEFRPIKGTVKKTSTTTLEQASKILLSSKEKAENLMIVDLVRHDLHSIESATNVCVPQLFGIEEYKTVYQLVSVIQGQLKVPKPISPLSDSSPISISPSSTHTLPLTSTTTYVSGLAVLQSALPPGSMTGAPKLRSCQILQSLEQSPRGLYSGVMGYMDVGGGGDFSVVIRTAYRWDGDVAEDGRSHIWTIGAGGAITAKNDPEAEYDEMRLKANSVLRAFGLQM